MYMNLLLLCSLNAYDQRMFTCERRTFVYVRSSLDFLVVFWIAVFIKYMSKHKQEEISSEIILYLFLSCLKTNLIIMDSFLEDATIVF